LSNIVPTNTTLIDIKSIKSISSNKKSIDYRFYNISKSLYTVDFFINYANYITPAILSLNGKTKKALIFDCDNTLWGGVIGEDGIDNIKMSNNGEGRFYREVQYLTKALVKKGVIVGLCSKNDLDDVDRVFKTHKDMVLTDSDISIKKVNWKDKVENIISISKDLNIGLDSIVFIDDSNFEINNIVDRLPDISVFKVPDKIYKYPAIFRELTSLFYSHSVSDEDKNKTNFYTTDIARKNKRNSYKDITMYLKSLNLTLNVYTDLISQVPRISQLTQKTNQFNLTTKRYSGEDIKKFISSDNYKVYTFDLSDNFGSYGLTGLCIIELLDNCVYIDSFLMSCRVIGRNVEYNFVYFVINSLLEQGFCEFYSSYKKTEKNKQVEKFWEKIGFKLHEIENDGKFKYKLLKKNYNDHQLDYITINKYEK
jgi:FkbH-like protein